MEKKDVAAAGIYRETHHMQPSSIYRFAGHNVWILIGPAPLADPVMYVQDTDQRRDYINTNHQHKTSSTRDLRVSQ